MSELLLLNPRKRGSNKRRAARPHGSRRGKSRKSATRRRGRNIVVMENPRRRRKSGRKRGHHRRVSMRNLTRGRRRNPIRLDLQSTILDAGLGTAGALGLDLMFAKLSPHLGTFLGSLPAQYAFKSALAVGLGIGADKVLKFKRAKAIADGALTVTFHEAARAAISKFAPTLSAQMGDLQITTTDPAYINPAPIVGYDNGGMGELQPYVPESGGFGDLQYNGRVPLDVNSSGDMSDIGA